MTTTDEPIIPDEPVAVLQIRRNVTALVVESITADAAVWDSSRPADPTDVRIVLVGTDTLGRETAWTIEPREASAAAMRISNAVRDATRMIGELS